jgi:hypothetical protein|tara:strand:+ start:45 stop:512 length:468 start_codon:yes stop_codon:yes gene_type:complete
MSDTKQAKRSPRSVEKRENEERNQSWSPPNLLPDPHPKDGWSFKWIRISTQGQDDPTNYSKKLREGWEAVPIEDAPEMEHLVLDPSPRFKGKVEVGGLLLCRMPENMAKQRNEHYRSQSSEAMKSVDNALMKESNPRMPINNPNRDSRVSFGKGT